MDSHLNSVHLPDFRREEFRQARQRLFQARGTDTQRIEAGQLDAIRAGATCLEEIDDKGRVPSHFVLVDRDHVYPLRYGTNTIGRLPDNDVVVASPQVSRRHCALLIHANESVEVHDIASKNGTFVNGQKINSATRLKPGDEITMCDYRLIFKSAQRKGSDTHCENQ